MERITQRDLEGLCDVVNDAKGFERRPYGERTKKGCNPNPNVYHLNYAYGRVQLVQMSPEKGCTGVSEVFGYGTKRELYGQMRAFIKGMEVKGY